MRHSHSHCHWHCVQISPVLKLVGMSWSRRACVILILIGIGIVSNYLRFWNWRACLDHVEHASFSFSLSLALCPNISGSESAWLRACLVNKSSGVSLFLEGLHKVRHPLRAPYKIAILRLSNFIQTWCLQSTNCRIPWIPLPQTPITVPQMALTMIVFRNNVMREKWDTDQIFIPAQSVYSCNPTLLKANSFSYWLFCRHLEIK